MTSSLGDALSALLGDGAGTAGDSSSDSSGGRGSGGNALDGLSGARAEVTDVLFRVLGDDAPEEAPGLDSTLRGDIGLDRLGVVELLVRCEEETGVRFEDEHVTAMKTLGDVVSHVEAGRSD
ncbi:acyl carrier protein [Corynebacterium hansenii]|uniref:Acyl carrier protein n=1 Tax=Corynebacterium hansenii TaxID=394964 RepID=A0ABV7ZMU3_9CORY|nr:acyl carrier protein [Corynebacterium hansenii]WJZ00470.1 acyl carrier protein [Corynebacterium hansenii]